MLLELGAANVTTLEYNEVESRVDNVRVIGNGCKKVQVRQCLGICKADS